MSKLVGVGISDGRFGDARPGDDIGWFLYCICFGTIIVIGKDKITELVSDMLIAATVTLR